MQTHRIAARFSRAQLTLFLHKLCPSVLSNRMQEVAKSAGLTLSALINSYLTQVVATRHIEPYTPELTTPQLEALLTEIESSLATGADLSKPFNSAEEFLADLKK